MQLEVEPAEVGPNDLDVYVGPVTPDHFAAIGASLGRAGTWTVSVTTVAEGTPTTTTFEVPVR